MIELSLSFVWWHAVLVVLGVIYVVISIGMGYKAGWKMMLIWPIYMLFALFGWVSVQ